MYVEDVLVIGSKKGKGLSEYNKEWKCSNDIIFCHLWIEMPYILVEKESALKMFAKNTNNITLS